MNEYDGESKMYAGDGRPEIENSLKYWRRRRQWWSRTQSAQNIEKKNILLKVFNLCASVLCAMRRHFQRPQFNKLNGSDCTRMEQQHKHIQWQIEINVFIFSLSLGAAIHELRDWKPIAILNTKKREKSHFIDEQQSKQ